MISSNFVANKFKCLFCQETASLIYNAIIIFNYGESLVHHLERYIQIQIFQLELYVPYTCRFLCVDTIEEKIAALQEKKKALADSVLKG